MAATKPAPRTAGKNADRPPDPLALGLNLANPLAVHGALLAGLPFSALVHFERASNLPRVELAELIAVPLRTLVRRQKEKRLQPDESERLYRVAKLYRLARGLFPGDEDAADRWLRTPRPALGDQSPLTLAKTEVGAQQVEELIHRLEHGVYL